MKNKKFIICLLLLMVSCIILIVVAFNFLKSYALNKSFENSILDFANKNQNIIFSIDETVLFSSADSKNKSSSASNFTIENLFQFTDIALFLNNNSDENTMENTLKKVVVNNFKYSTSPSMGTPSLYYKNINNFAKSDIIEDNVISNGTLNFTISQNDEANLDSPTLYNNCANPIVLSYVNSNIKTDYTFTDTSTPITYDGSLLKRCSVLLSSISCSFSFDINITNNLDQEFKTTIFIDIPLEDENSNSSNTENKQETHASIYDGKYILKDDTKYIFYRYK